jgi:transmembrane protein
MTKRRDRRKRAEMTPRPIALVLESPVTWFLCRLLMTFMFWWEGLGFLRTFGQSIPILNVTGTQPAWLIPALTILVLLAGSVLILIDRFLWLGAGMLAVFTALTILLVHRFWAMTGQEAIANWREAEEHVAVIGGLAALSIISHMRRQLAPRA